MTNIDTQETDSPTSGGGAPSINGLPVRAAILDDGTGGASALAFYAPTGVDPFELAQLFQRAHDMLLTMCTAQARTPGRVLPVGAGVGLLVPR